MKYTAEVATQRYHLSQRILHWLVAVLVIGSLSAGMTLGFLGFEGARDTFGMAMTNTLYTSHKTVGILILIFMVARLALRIARGKPEYYRPLPGWQRMLSQSVHGLLYVLLIAMPVVGWLATAAGGFPVEFFHWHLPGLIGENDALSEQLFFWHATLGWIILALVLLHITGALYHWRIRRDGVMQRMSLFG
ncbi:cytochrome b [Aquisalimonas sp. 2447]|uniref:cytochrome b n=1 Tax=Aquisalimonas sp. 2447 TaxID=2740807 RepID=UPI0014326969|nr:cytochrome b [Aquisalimonas sp. 2447]QIT54086.1 cytochrome b [Aquisalimonas sp. 2447]